MCKTHLGDKRIIQPIERTEAPVSKDERLDAAADAILAGATAEEAMELFKGRKPKAAKTPARASKRAAKRTSDDPVGATSTEAGLAVVPGKRSGEQCTACGGPLESGKDRHFHSRRSAKGGAEHICCTCRPESAGRCTLIDNPLPAQEFQPMPTATKSRSTSKTSKENTKVMATATKQAAAKKSASKTATKKVVGVKGENEKGFSSTGTYGPCSVDKKNTMRKHDKCGGFVCLKCQPKGKHVCAK